MLHPRRTPLLIALAAWLSLSQAAFATDPIVCIDEDDFVPPAVAPAPQALTTGLPRAIYEGATPADLDPNRPVLVFVHGLNGTGEGWFGETMYYGRNDMYDTAYAAGYKTFFVDLYDVGAEAESSITNGVLLRQQINAIRSYWGVDAVNIVAHSKGGPDANFAALFGAPIDSVVTLGGAHYGSPLADLAQTDWLEWLAELIGFNDAGTKFMQTACMDLVRGFLDANPVNNRMHYYTAGGTGWGPFLSALEFGGLYLYTQCPDGENDGVVCLEHARHPLSRDASGNVTGTHRLIWDVSSPDFEVDHDKIRRGNGFFDFFWFWEPDDCYVPVFDSIEPYAGQFNANLPQAPVAATPARSQGQRSAVAGNILRGGALGAGVSTVSFPLEAGVTGLDVRVLTARADTRIELVSPSGRTHTLSAAAASKSEYFAGSYVSGARVERRALRRSAGEWQLRFTASADDAYAVLVNVTSPLSVAVVSPAARTLAAAGGVDLAVASDVRTLRTQARVRRISTAGPAVAVGAFSADNAQDLRVPLAEPGVYNLALTITGVTQGGDRFERSQVLSYAVPGATGGVPEACR
ncbi:MAG: alpha/beta fold hydrolase [Pseudomonadota bacterium]